MVGERRPLRETGGAARVLDVDRVVEVELLAVGRQVSRVAGARGELLPVRGVEVDRALELRQIRPDVVDHLDEVGVLQALRGDDPPAARLHERVLKLVHAVGGIDVDEDHPGLRGCVLGQGPFGAIGAPHSHPVALAQAGGEHPAREPIHRFAELRIRVANPVAAVDERLGIGDARDRPLEVVPDRLPEQRIDASAVCVGQHLDSLLPRCWRRCYWPVEVPSHRKVSLAMTMLRDGLLEGRAMALAGGVPPAVSDRLGRLSARVHELPPELELEFDEERASSWVGAAGSLYGIVYDARPAFGAGGQDGLRECLERGWIAVRAVATGALIPAGTGKVLLIAPRPDAGSFAAAARAALENLARTLSVEWARYGVGTVAIAPGASTTDDEVAELVCFLVSPAAEYLSGCVFELGTLIRSS